MDGICFSNFTKNALELSSISVRVFQVFQMFLNLILPCALIEDMCISRGPGRISVFLSFPLQLKITQNRESSKRFCVWVKKEPVICSSKSTCLHCPLDIGPLQCVMEKSTKECATSHQRELAHELWHLFGGFSSSHNLGDSLAVPSSKIKALEILECQFVSGVTDGPMSSPSDMVLLSCQWLIQLVSQCCL